MESVEDIVKKTQERVKIVLERLTRNKDALSFERMEEVASINTCKLSEEIQRHPGYVAFYNGMRAMVTSAIRECERTLELIDGELYDYYKTEYEVSLSTNEIKHYITHDKLHREFVHMISVLDRERLVLEGIVDALSSKGYALNNLVKLRQVELEQQRLEAPIPT